jgi:hypothetical protein
MVWVFLTNFWYTKVYADWYTVSYASPPEMHPQPLSLFSPDPDFFRPEPSCPQAVVQLCPQFAVDNSMSTNKVFKYLWISLRQLNIMMIVLSKIGKTLGFGRFAWGGRGAGLAVIIVGAAPPPKKQNGLELSKPNFPKGKKWNSPLQPKRENKKERKSAVAPRVRSR